MIHLHENGLRMTHLHYVNFFELGKGRRILHAMKMSENCSKEFKFNFYR